MKEWIYYNHAGYQPYLGSTLQFQTPDPSLQDILDPHAVVLVSCMFCCDLLKRSCLRDKDWGRFHSMDSKVTKIHQLQCKTQNFTTIKK